MTYIDGLFEQVYDSATGNLTYRHYILAGGARVGVETINANSGGTITSDTLSFFVRDAVGSVIATVTESLGGANQASGCAGGPDLSQELYHGVLGHSDHAHSGPDGIAFHEAYEYLGATL